MANKRHKPEEIVTKLRQVDVLVGQGMARIDAIRQVCIVVSLTGAVSKRGTDNCPHPLESDTA